MNHHDINEKIDAYYDGELSVEETAKIKIHLSQCAECAEALRRWTRISKTFFQPTEIMHSEAFITRVMASIRVREDERSSRALFWKIPAFAVGSLALFLVFTTPMEPAPSTRDLLLDNQRQSSAGPLTGIGSSGASY